MRSCTYFTPFTRSVYVVQHSSKLINIQFINHNFSETTQQIVLYSLIFIEHFMQISKTFFSSRPDMFWFFNHFENRRTSDAKHQVSVSEFASVYVKM